MRLTLPSIPARLALLVLATGVVYASGLSAPFVHDDLPTIVDNPVTTDVGLLADPDRLDRVIGIPDLRNSIKARTFVYLTFALNHSLLGPGPDAFRIVNIAIHAVNACLVYLLAAQLLALARRRGSSSAAVEPPGARAGWMALAVALLFAVHPINASAVTYVTQRFTSLATLLYLLAIVAYLRGRAAPSVRGAAPYLVASLLATALAMDTKEIAFTLPVTLTLVEATFLAGPWRRRALRLAPFYATMLIIPVTLWSSVAADVGVAQHAIQVTDLMNLDHLPRASYLLTQFPVLVTYLRLLLVPVGLNFDHDFPVFHSLLDPPVVASCCALAMLLALGVQLLAWAGRGGSPFHANHRIGAFGILFFFLTISMSSSVIPINDVINEYRVYLPSVGLYLLLVSGADTALRRAFPPPEGPGVRGGIALTAAVALCLLAGATIARNHTWRSGLTFWEDAGRKSPGKLRVARQLATEYLTGGMPGAAVDTLQTLIRLNPDLGRPHFFLGEVYLVTGRIDDAIAEFKRAMAVRSDVAEIHLGLARAYLAQGRRALAADALDAVERLEPGSADLAPLRARLASEPGGAP